MTIFNSRKVHDEKEFFISKLCNDIQDSSCSAGVKNFLYNLAVRVYQVLFRVSDDRLFANYSEKLLDYNQILGSQFHFTKPQFSQEIYLKIAKKKFKRIVREVVRQFCSEQKNTRQFKDLKNVRNFLESAELKGSTPEEKLMTLIQANPGHKKAFEGIQKAIQQLARKDALIGADVIYREFDASIDMDEKERWKLFACARINDVATNTLPQFIHENFQELTLNLPENFAEKIALREVGESCLKEILRMKVDALKRRVFSYFDLNINSKESDIVDELTSFSLITQSGKYIESYLPSSDYYDKNKHEKVYIDAEDAQNPPYEVDSERSVNTVACFLTTEITQVKIVSDIFQKYSSRITEQKFEECFRKWDKIALDPDDLERIVLQNLKP